MIELLYEIQEIIHDINKSDINKLLDIDLLVLDTIREYECSYDIEF